MQHIELREQHKIQLGKLPHDQNTKYMKKTCPITIKQQIAENTTISRTMATIEVRDGLKKIQWSKNLKNYCKI